MSDRKEQEEQQHEGQHEARREALLRDFPRLLHGNLPDLPYVRGWDGVIRDLLRKIDRLLDDDQAAAFRVMQIKQKFGTLRLYYEVDGLSQMRLDVQDGQGLPVHLTGGKSAGLSFPHAQTDELISKAEKLTTKICEGCGVPSGLRRHGALYTTRCDACLTERIRTQRER
jgi:hypothetical protein